MKQLYYAMRAKCHSRDAIDKLRHLETRLPSAASRFAIPFVFRGKCGFRSIRPRQHPLEIENLYTRVCELAPKRVLEIGTAKGGTFYLWTQAAQKDATLVSVDLPGGNFGGGYPTYRREFYEAFAKPDQRVTLLREDSHTSETHQKVLDAFDGQPIDFAFIDGDHSYDGACADFLHYGQMVRPGGVIAFHDILLQPWDPAAQVFKLWQQIRDRYETHELIDTQQSRQIGIGFLVVPEKGISETLD